MRPFPWWCLVVLALGCRRTGEPEATFDADAGTTEVPALEAVPSAWVGRFVEGTGVVARVLAPEAFFVGREGYEILVLLDHAGPLPEVAVGDRVRVTGRLLTGQVHDTLPASTSAEVRRTALAQDRFLLADGEDVISWSLDADVGDVPPRPSP